MRPVDEDERFGELKRLGISRPVIRLAAGKNRRDFFTDFRTPYKVYRGITWKGGTTFVPLWEKYDTVTAVREKGKGLEFIRFSVERVGKPRPLARTEQGLLATLFFNPLNSYYDDPEDYGRGHLRAMRQAADSVGFLHFERAEAVFRDNYSKGLAAFERAYRKLIREIDAGGQAGVATGKRPVKR
jgi:hypothetical protein